MTTERDRRDDADRLSEDAVRRLLDRATQLEAQRAELSIAQLREAAREAGIEPIAFEQAVAEFRAGSAPGSTKELERAPAQFKARAAAWSAALIAVGVLTYALLRLFP